MEVTLKQLRALLNVIAYFEEKFPAYCKYTIGPTENAKVTNEHPSDWYLSITVGPVTGPDIISEWIQPRLRNRAYSHVFITPTHLEIHMYQTATIALLGAFTNYMYTYYYKEYDCIKALNILSDLIPYTKGIRAMRDGNMVTESPSRVITDPDTLGVVRAAVLVIRSHKDLLPDPVVMELQEGINIVP